jgi:predicted transcriptional regulator
MRECVIDIIFASRERKDILLFLKSGPQDMEFILESLESDRQALLPHMRILEENFLVTQFEDVWELTTIGELIADEMISLLSTADVLDSDIDYWGSHSLDFIPSYLIKRMNELGKCKVLDTPVAHEYELNREIIQTSPIAGSLFIAAAFIQPKCLTALSEMAQKNVDIYLILSQNALDKLRSRYAAYFEKLIKSKSFHFYVYSKELGFQAFMYNDYYLLLHLLKNNGEHDNKRILCSNPYATEWGKDLFGYYLKDSMPIAEMQLNTNKGRISQLSKTEIAGL